jgi:N-alpha-acetyltransferase 15/16, NatA auxiliary subunit
VSPSASFSERTITINSSSEKYLLALKCLLALHAIDSEDPSLHVHSFCFRSTMDHGPDGVVPRLAEILPAATRILFLDGKDLSEWNDDFLSRHKSSASHLQAGLRVRALLGKESKDNNEKDLLTALSLESTTLREARAGLELLNEWGSSAEAKDRYMTSAAERWTRASVFQPKHIESV